MFDNTDFASNPLYYILMLLVYSGGASWLVSQLTRSRKDARAENRTAIANNLALIQSLARTQNDLEDPQRKAEFKEMSERLVHETTERIGELNAEESDHVFDPASRYVIIPTPKSVLGAFMSLVFAFAIYFAAGSLVLILAYIFDGKLNLFESQEDLEWTLKTVAVSLGLGMLAFGARHAAFWSYRKCVRTQRAQYEGQPQES